MIVEMADAAVARAAHRPASASSTTWPEDKGLGFSVEVAPGMPDDIVTDPQRLRQVLKNLLANAFKFTERGEVHVRVGLAERGWDRRTRVTGRARRRSSPCPSATPGSASTRSTAADLRGLRPGRRHDRPPVRRHRPRPVDQPGAGRRCWAVRSPWPAHPAGQHLHRLPAAGSDRPVIAADDHDARHRASIARLPDATLDLRPDAGNAEAEPAQHGRRRLGRRSFGGTKVLVVDDDFRNIFALTALLERGHAEVTVAESGPEALAVLERDPTSTSC